MGLSAEKLARILAERYAYRIDSTTLTKIETGDSRPNVDLLFILCDLYRVDLNSLCDADLYDRRASLRFLWNDLELTEELHRLASLSGERAAAHSLLSMVRTLNDSLEDAAAHRLRPATGGNN